MRVSTRRSRRLAILVTLGVAAASTMAVISPVEAFGPGSPATWGGNGFGQLGDGSTAAHRTAEVIDLDGVTDLHGGREHVIALLSNGTVRTWGSNDQGQIGDGTTANRPNPTTVPGVNGIVAVETGHYHSLALGADGRIWSWGYNAFGQLGDGSTTRRLSPVRVQGIANAVGIAAGRDMSYAIRSDGTLWAWGLNGDGQLGDGTTVTRTTPVRVGNLTNVVDVAGGRDHGLAVLANGQVWAWGWNAYAQVGDGTTADRTNPILVTGLAAASSVIAGAHHSYALLDNGQVWSWGRNYRAQLGDGTTTQRSRPVRVGSLTNVVEIGSGRDHGLAVLADGTVRAWGNNEAGQLGDGTLTRRPNPITVPGLDDAEVVGGGSDYSVALVGNGGPPPPPPPGNESPNAAVGASCTGLSCSFNSGGSNDPDGTIVSRSWTFGDGTSAGGVSPSHVYGGAGTYTVTVTVTDDDGASDSASTSVTVAEPSGSAPVFRVAAATNVNTTTARVGVPGSVVNGDLLLLFVTTSANTSASTPSGWTLRDSEVDGSIASRLFTRTVTAGVAGSTVSVTLGQRAKTDMSLVAYRDASFAAAAVAPEPGSSTSHTTPSVGVVAADSVVVSHWVDKTSNASSWSLPGNVIQRLVSNGTGGGRINSATGDTTVGAMTWPGATAVAANPANKAVMWSVVVAPG